MKTDPRFVLAFSALLPMAALGGCMDGNPVKDLAQSAGIGGEPKPAPDFVTRTRAPNYEFMPVGESAPKRRLRAKDAAGVTSAEASMDEVRTRNEARGAVARQAAQSVTPAAPVVVPKAN